jgi:hypothetical protein
MNDDKSTDGRAKDDTESQSDDRIYSRLSKIPTKTNLQLDSETPEPERMKLYFRYATAFDNYLKRELKQDPPPADISEAIWKKFMTLRFEKISFKHQGPGKFRRFLEFVLNSSINDYRRANRKVALSDGELLDSASNPRIAYLKPASPGDDLSQSDLTENHFSEDGDDPIRMMQAQTIDYIDHYTERLGQSLDTDGCGIPDNVLASEEEIKSMVRRVLQALVSERLVQIEKESREIDMQGKLASQQENKTKRGDSRWKYIAACKICAEYRIETGRSTADIKQLVDKLTTLVAPETISGDVAKKWASRGSQIYARALVQVSSDMFATDDVELLEEELAELGLLSIKFVRDVLSDDRRPFL